MKTQITTAAGLLFVGSALGAEKKTLAQTKCYSNGGYGAGLYGGGLYGGGLYGGFGGGVCGAPVVRAAPVCAPIARPLAYPLEGGYCGGGYGDPICTRILVGNDKLSRVGSKYSNRSLDRRSYGSIKRSISNHRYHRHFLGGSNYYNHY